MTNMDLFNNLNPNELNNTISTSSVEINETATEVLMNKVEQQSEQVNFNNVIENTQVTSELTFNDLGLPDFIINAVTDIGFTNPTAIQIKAIPNLMAGRDILGLAQTGSGKTASFMLPLLTRLDASSKKVQILVLSPTRELAIQVENATQDFVKYLPKVNSVAIYGGQPYGGQIRALKAGVQIVIATPGRLVDHINKGTIHLDSLKAVVLDEADEMLSMGFADDLDVILSAVPKEAQMALFSATMPKTIESLTKKYLKDPEVIRIKSSKTNEPRIEQFYWLVQGYTKDSALIRFLEIEEYDAAIVFCRTRQGCNELAEVLLKNNIPAACLHGDMSQEIRESTLNGLRNESINVLVATDVAARGLDIDRLDLVINYDLPQDNESYVHRIGRTGRAGREGRSISFVSEKERIALYNIEKTVKKELTEIKVPNNKQLEEFRRNKFRLKLEAKLDDHNLERYTHLVEELIPQDYEAEQVIAALVNMATHDYKLVLPKEKIHKLHLTYDRSLYENKNFRGRDRKSNKFSSAGNDWETFYLGIGRDQKVEVKQILQTINRYLPKIQIGSIQIRNNFSTIELPRTFNSKIIEKMKDARIGNIPLNIRIFEIRGGERGGKRDSFSNRSDDNRRKFNNEFSNLRDRTFNSKQESSDKRDIDYKDGFGNKRKKDSNLDRRNSSKNRSRRRN